MNFTPEPYQVEAASWLSRQRKGLLCSPAGSGKTLMLAMALDAVIRSKPRTTKVKVGWMANTLEQCEQAHKAMDVFPSLTDQADRYVFCAAAQRNWGHVDVLVVDECHHLGSAEGWQVQARTCQGALWGMTATPKVGDFLKDKTLLDIFDNRIFTVGRENVSDRVVSARVFMLNASDPGTGPLIDAEIERLLPIRRNQFRWCKTPLDEHQIYRMVAWQAAVEIGIVANVSRNNAAVRCAIHHKENYVLVLVNRVEHAQEIASSIGPHAIPCFSKMGKKKRASALDAFKSGQSKCIVATSLSDEGIDLPMAEVLVLVSAGRSTVKGEQRTGRILRTHAGKTEGIVYDFLDTSHPLMARHAQKRMALYKKLGYTVEMPGAREIELAL